MIGIRVDVNETIATGHFMRCLSIAQGIRKAQGDVLFVSADERAKILAEQYGFQAIKLDTKWDDMDSEVGIFKVIINNYQIEKLLVDSYYVTEKYLQQLSESVELIYIDDINTFKYPVDVLINYNACYNIFKYDETYGTTNTKLLLGPQYAPLRNEFRMIRRDIHHTVENILITSGGSDPYGAIEHLIDRIIKDEQLSCMNIHVVAGKYSTIDEKISLTTCPKIKLYKNIENISDLMIKADIAITASGSTMYELCACGVPSVSFAFADNQIYGARALDDIDLIPFSGDLRNGIEECIEIIIDHLLNYIGDYKLRKQKSKAMQCMVDGLGVDRIVKEILGDKELKG